MSISGSQAPLHDPEISIFLLLCPEHQRLIEDISTECRRIVSSERFIPHMTVYFGSGSPSRGACLLVESIGLCAGPIRQRIIGVGGEARFWRASYITLNGGGEVEALDGKLRRDIYNYGDYSLFPHVSLLYAHEITPSQQIQIQRLTRERLSSARIDELVFDKIAVFQRHAPDAAWEDVSRWREVCAASLRGIE